MKWCIIGGDGLIGAQLLELASRKNIPCKWSTRRTPDTDDSFHLDLGAQPESWKIPDGNFDVAFLCAAVTSQKHCEDDPQSSRQINVHHTLELARYFTDRGTHIVFLSSNLVFDLNLPLYQTTSPTNPICEYGRQKADVEKALLEAGSSTIVRLGKVLHEDMPLVTQWVQSLERGETIHPFSDFRIGPVSLSYIIEGLATIASARHSGIVHLGNNIDASYAEIARFIAGMLGFSPSLVQPTTSTEAGVNMKCIPHHGTLDMSETIETFRIEPPNLWDTIVRLYVADLITSGNSPVYSPKWERIFQVRHPWFEFLAERAEASPLRRARLCLHRSHEDLVQEMLIVLLRGCYVKPHRQEGREKSYTVFEGKMRLVFFDESGNTLRTVRLDAGDAGARACRFDSSVWHTVICLNERASYVETTNGPFRKNETSWAPWACSEDDHDGVQKFIATHSL